jgi:hypothetical protein
MGRTMAEPKTVVAQRLEGVRAWLGFETVRDLREGLRKHGFQVSYQTLRNWHRGDREPSLDYYAALYRLYGISLEFLLLGEGPVLKEEEGADLFEDARGSGRVGLGPRDLFSLCVPDGFPLEQPAPLALLLWWNAINRIVMASPEREIPPEVLVEVGRWALQVSMEPALLLSPTDDQGWGEGLDGVWIDGLWALTAAIPNPAEGIPLWEVVQRIRQVRKAS